MPGSHTVALGITVRRGSRHEPKHLAGISHFLEHAWFKGSRRWNTREIAERIDELGGDVNAQTGREDICLHARVLSEHTDAALDLLGELLLNPRFDGEEIEREKSVVLEELKSAEDTPDDCAHELFVQRLWRGHALARPILGTRATVRSFNPTRLRGYHHAMLRGENIAVVAAGDVSHNALAAKTSSLLRGVVRGSSERRSRPPDVVGGIGVRTRRGLSQSYICLGTSTYPAAHRRRHALRVLETVLGVGVSSRLFQTIREVKSLAYEVGCETASFEDGGYLAMAAVTRPDAVRETVATMLEEARRLANEPLSADELSRAKAQTCLGLRLDLESTFLRMAFLSAAEVQGHGSRPLSEITRGVERVTAHELRQLATEVFLHRPLALAIVGEKPAKLGGKNFDLGRPR